MARKKTSVLDSPPNASDRNDLNELTSTVDRLAQEVRVLREAIDELREVIDWTMKNRDAPVGDHPPVTPHDSADIEPGEIDPTTSEHLRDEDVTSVAAPGELF